MKKGIILGFIVTFIVVSVIDYLWHSVIFASFYTSALAGAAYFGPTGAVAPLLPYLIVSDALLAIIFLWFIPQMGGNNSSSTLAMRGGLLGLLTIGHLATVNHALIHGWAGSVIFADGAFGLVTGVIVSFIIGAFYRKSMAQKPAGMM